MEQSGRFFTFEEAKSKIEYWCSYRDRSEYETIQKLYSFHQSESDISKIVVYLREFNFLNDERFANSFVSGKFRIKNWGRKKIYAAILQKRVEKSLVQNALNSIDDNEYRNAIELLIEKKNHLLRNEKEPWKKKQKVLQYLISRGYEYDLVIDVYTKI